MKLWTGEIHRETKGHGDLHDLTADVTAVVKCSGIRAGILHLFVIGSTGALTTMEFEPGLVGDLRLLLDRLVPPSEAYGHQEAWHDGNGHSHLQASLLRPDLTLPIREGEPVLGRWQQVVLVECDVRPHQRIVVLTIFGD